MSYCKDAGAKKDIRDLADALMLAFILCSFECLY